MVVTDSDLKAFRLQQKRVTNPAPDWVQKPARHPVNRQRTFSVTGTSGSADVFEIYQRQNLTDDSDYSCGISVQLTNSRLTLARYNGPSHKHLGTRYRQHIHRATERAMREGKKHPEYYATETDRYDSLDEALSCLAECLGRRHGLVDQGVRVLEGDLAPDADNDYHVIGLPLADRSH